MKRLAIYILVWLTFVTSFLLTPGVLQTANSSQYVDRILRPCAAGATPYVSVITLANGNIALTTCAGGQALLNGVPLGGGGGGVTCTGCTSGTLAKTTGAGALGNSLITETTAGDGVITLGTGGGGSSTLIRIGTAGGSISSAFGTFRVMDNAGAVFFPFQAAAITGTQLTASGVFGLSTTVITFSAAGAHISQSAANTDLAGTLALVAATSVSKTFTQAWNSAPSCTISPTSNPGGTIFYWVTSTTGAVTLNSSAAATITFNYHCIGNPN